MSKNELRLSVLKAIRSWHKTFVFSPCGAREPYIRNHIFPGLAPCDNVQEVLDQLEQDELVVSNTANGENPKYMLTMKGVLQLEEAFKEDADD